jgi:hypothetical protein
MDKLVQWMTLQALLAELDRTCQVWEVEPADLDGLWPLPPDQRARLDTLHRPVKNHCERPSADLTL